MKKKETNDILIKWFPPSWVQIKYDNMVVYIDPAFLRTNFLDYPKTIEFSRWPAPIDGLPEELEIADLILITHHHKDHCKDVTIKRLAGKNTTIFAPKICEKEIPFPFSAVKAGNKFDFKNIKIEVTEAYNLPKYHQQKVNHPKGKGVGYIITINGKSIYHTGDSDLIPEMEKIKNIDLAFFPIGNRNFTMDVEEAIMASKIIKPRMIVPIHRFKENPIEFKNRVEQEIDTIVLSAEIGEIIRM